MAAHDLPRSPLAPKTFPSVDEIRGVGLRSYAAGFKYKGRDDLLIAVFEPGTQAAGVFTSSKAAAASVHWCKKTLEQGTSARALIVTAGNANAYTGAAGESAITEMVAALTAELKCEAGQVLIAQTGVIGQPFPADKFISACRPALASPTASFEQAARAIATTDTFPKAAMKICEIDGVSVTLSGIAKGSGMIAPDMATMLGFVMTDAQLPSLVLQQLLKRAVDHSFNAITVDGDTSTNDMVLAFATGAAGNPDISDAADPRLEGFAKALEALCQDLAQQIVRDGEGASKFLSITVQGAKSEADAKAVAMTIANSPLIKTAVAGEDPNWGRIIMGVGKAPVDLNVDQLKLYFGPKLVAEQGAVCADYSEDWGVHYFKQAELEFTIDLCDGEAAFTVWTCDLTHGYISINADYRS
ncbi:MAG: bifunctional glutamate N-acetyltransferase/amino-acid acetyltransferase ArgJ [Sphingomonadales bacterium]|jgi:glutamate N-acetyltransferase/amino-acid N-acetyltransferase